MAVVISENWIRERVGLKHNSLEDVRSLSLPGTYHEKINALGESLRQFTRLKSLDLSRNGLGTIAGIEGLKLLEKLNLYYNNIASLQELHRLRYNKNLQELDLRLNPVARNEPDYRLFLIHMLPSLRRLDDRAVRDSERKAALMHFSSEQAAELTQHSGGAASSGATEECAPSNPRAEHVKQLAKPPTIMDEDDARLFEYLNPERGTLTGSKAKQPSMEEYNLETLRQMNMAGMGLEGARPVADPPLPDNIRPQPPKQLPPTQQYYPPDTDEDPLAELSSRYPNLASMSAGCQEEQEPRQGFGLHDEFQENHGAKHNGDANLKFSDEAEAYTAYKAQGYFTANPGDDAAGASGGRGGAVETPSGQRGAELYTAEDLDKDLQKLKENRSGGGGSGSGNSSGARRQVELVLEPTSGGATSGGSKMAVTSGCMASAEELLDSLHDESAAMMPGDFGEAIARVSDLVDKYWNGSRSLLKNVRFKNHLVSLLKEFRQGASDAASVASNASLEFEMSRMRQQLERARQENEGLKERMFQENLSNEPVCGMDEAKLRQSLIRAQRDVKIMKERVAKCMDEKRALEERLGGGGTGETPSTSLGRAAHPPKATSNAEIGRIERENETLRNQINTLNIRLKAHSQMSEMAAMLQQSHKSLVTTNDHLLKELEETKRRHKEEVNHLTHSYNQMRQSLAQARGAQRQG